MENTDKNIEAKKTAAEVIPHAELDDEQLALVTGGADPRAENEKPVREDDGLYGGLVRPGPKPPQASHVILRN